MTYDPNCPECEGTGLRDSGGTQPWGEPISLPCDCDQPLAPKTKIYWYAGITADQEGVLTHYKSDGKGGLIEEEK